MSIRNPFEIMHEDAAALLARRGIKYRANRKGGVTWFNMARCPLCGHEGFQCAISESVGTAGKLYHGIKCFHVTDNGLGTDTPPYEEFLYSIGELTAREYSAIKNYARPSRTASLTLPPPNIQMVTKSEKTLRPLNPEFHATLRKRLRENDGALAYLEGRGMTQETVDYFGLGLSMPYVSRRTNGAQSDALVYPLRGADGIFINKYGYYNIPSVTQNPVDKNGWMSGDVRTYYADAVGDQKSVFVCEGAKDVWRHWQALQRSSLAGDILLVTSTHGSAFPDEWKNPSFWAKWETVFFGQDNDEAGDLVASKLPKFRPK